MNGFLTISMNFAPITVYFESDVWNYFGSAEGNKEDKACDC